MYFIRRAEYLHLLYINQILVNNRPVRHCASYWRAGSERCSLPIYTPYLGMPKYEDPHHGVCRSWPNKEINHLQIWSLQIMPKYGDKQPPNMESADHAQIWRSTTSKYGVCN